MRVCVCVCVFNNIDTLPHFFIKTKDILFYNNQNKYKISITLYN